MALLLDNSAWARLDRQALAEERRSEIASWLEEGRLATTLPFLLEAGYSARSGPAYATMMVDLALLPRIDIDEHVTQLALAAQGQLAAIGHHRLPPADVMIAACAHCHGLGVLHYDKDYDVLAKRSGLVFESHWLAPAGSLA